jgi:hypothetical protein
VTGGVLWVLHPEPAKLNPIPMASSEANLITFIFSLS